MFSGDKLKQACSKALSQRLEEDRISQLPDPLLSDILSHLPTKEAVKTSVLSTRWRSLWLLVSKLELEYSEFPNINTYKSFGDRFFDSNRVSSCIDNLKLTLVNENNIGEDVVYYITSWIDAAVNKHKVQHLHVRFPNYEMPLSLYTCETLVSLKLYRVALPNAEFVSLPCLKTMHLIATIWDPNGATFETLVSSCSVLEELKIQGRLRSDVKVYRVHSRSLKRLNIVRRTNYFYVTYVPGVVIDAPQLCCLRIIDDVSESFIVKNLEFIAKLDISLTFGLYGLSEVSFPSEGSHDIRNFLAGITNVGDMTICARTLEVLHYYSISELLPQFGYMSRLCVTLNAPNIKWLATFLESCPNLKSLVVVEYYCRERPMNHINVSYVPNKCLLSSLEFVDFQFPFSGLVAEVKLARYFLENSAILKKLTLLLDSHSKENEVFKKLLEIPKASTKCEVVIVNEKRGNM